MTEGLSHDGFAYDLRLGQLAENEFAEMVSRKDIEVKDDRMAAMTGRLFVEYECRGKPSGIQTTQAHYWAWRIGGVWLTVRTDDLKKLARVAWRDKARRRMGGDYDQSAGVLVPVLWLFSRDMMDVAGVAH